MRQSSPNLNRNKFFFGLFLLAVGGFFLFRFQMKMKPNPRVKAFNQLVVDSIARKAPIDLRNFETGKWNEMFFVFPYGSTSALKFAYTGPEIKSSDDSQMFTVFLQNGAYVGHALNSRRDADFATCVRETCDAAAGVSCKCDEKIAKDQAVFKTDPETVHFPTVKWIGVAKIL